MPFISYNELDIKLEKARYAGILEERERLLNQKANDHDNEVRKRVIQEAMNIIADLVTPDNVRIFNPLFDELNKRIETLK